MSNPSLKSMLNYKAAWQAKIDKYIAEQKQIAIQKVKALVEEHNITPSDVFDANSRKKAEVKYFDAVTGNSWTGRGKTPCWLQGKNREDYLIKN